MKVQNKICCLGLSFILVCIGCRKEIVPQGENNSSAVLDQQRIMLYQTLSRLAEHDKFNELQSLDVSLMIIEIYFPYYVHCKITRKNDEGIFGIVKKASRNSKGYIKRHTRKNWETIRSNPLGAGYAPEDIKAILSFEDYDTLAEMYEKDIGVEIYEKH